MATSDVFAFLAVRGRTLFNRGADNGVDRLQGRIAAVEKQPDDAAYRMTMLVRLQRVSR